MPWPVPTCKPMFERILVKLMEAVQKLTESQKKPFKPIHMGFTDWSDVPGMGRCIAIL